MDSLEKYTVAKDSERLTLKTLTVENMASDYVDWLNDPEILQYLEIRHAPKQTAESVAQFVQNMFESKDNLMMGMFLKDDGRHIGNIKLGPVNWRYGRADIGVIIGDKTLWGQGYAVEAIKTLCDISFKIVGLRRVQASACAGNKASLRAFERAGFHYEGTLKDYWLLNGRPEDEVLMGRVK